MPENPTTFEPPFTEVPDAEAKIRAGQDLHDGQAPGSSSDLIAPIWASANL